MEKMTSWNILLGKIVRRNHSGKQLSCYCTYTSIRYYFMYSLEDTLEQVTSSTENFSKHEPRTEGGMLPLDQPYSDSVERVCL